MLNPHRNYINNLSELWVYENKPIDKLFVGKQVPPDKTCEESVKLESMKSTKPEAAAAMAAAKEATDRGDMTGMCPPSRLSQFYEFFSLSHMTSPFLCK